jgi:hypothetical protein
MAVEFDHSLELERVKRENAMTLAEERLKTLERLMEMLDRFADAAGADPNSRRVRSRPTQEAAE